MSHLSLKFKASRVERLAAHTSECVTHFPTFANLFDKRFYPDNKLPLNPAGFPDVSKIDYSKTPRGFLLMLDDGAQLISSGLPTLFTDPITQEYEGVYADGFERGSLTGRAILGSVLGETGDRCIFIPLHWFTEGFDELSGEKYVEYQFPITGKR
tara:strand:+ start:354 stop:818 length:465 start_codon:yes stop_codon:yes gene_type:complete